jgi:TolB-like protein
MMKRVFFRNLISTVCLFTFFISPVFATTDFDKEIDQLSGNLAEKIAAAGKKKIAVVDFTDLDGSVTELGRFLAEEFSTALAGTGKGFIVVDRIHLKTLLKEHKLSSTGLIDQNTIRQLGKIAGVDALITGSLTPLGESVRINVKVLDIETAAVIEANRGNIAMTDAIKDLMRKGIITPASTASGSSITPIRARVETVQKIEEQNFVFEAIGCKVSGKNVTFSLLITNKDKDGNFYIYFKNTSLYDDFGNEYPVKKIQLGSAIQTSDYSYVGKVLFSGVPTRTFLTFEDVSPQATMGSAVVLNCAGERENNRKDFAVKFRGIPFSK